MSVQGLRCSPGTAETKPGAAIVHRLYPKVRARASATIRGRVAAAIRGWLNPWAGI